MRILRMAALILVAFVLAGTGTAAAAGSAATAGPAASGSPAACSGSLDVTVTFSQPSYLSDQTITVNVNAVNCTGQTLTTHIEPYGRFADAAGAIATGCQVIDPTWNPVTFAPNASYTASFSYRDVVGCQATQFIAYDSFYGADGALLAPGTGTVPISPAQPPAACHVTYAKQSEWQGGFTAAISITNTGQVADDGWELTFIFALGQQVGNVWGASATQTGQAVTLANLPWDATIAPGATINAVGMTGTWTTSDSPPTGFAVNGVGCT